MNPYEPPVHNSDDLRQEEHEELSLVGMFFVITVPTTIITGLILWLDLLD